MSIHTILSQIEKELVGKNIHSVYLRCNECKLFGVPMPLDRICGNCGSKDTIVYYDSETIKAFATRIVEEVGEKLIGEDEFVGEPHMILYEVGGQFESYSDEKIRNTFRASQRTKLQKMKEI